MTFDDESDWCSQAPFVNAASWIGAAVIWFAIFFFPIHLLGWWAFAFPPWLLVALVTAPLIVETNSFGPLLGLAGSWFAISALGITIGAIKRNMAILSCSVHLLLPLLALVASFYLALELNGGNLKGTS